VRVFALTGHLRDRKGESERGWEGGWVRQRERVRVIFAHKKLPPPRTLQ